MRKLAFVIIVCAGTLAVTGCKNNPSYCSGALDCLGADAGPPRCERSADCTAPTPICDVAEGACIACTPDQAAQCTGTTPVCGADDTCQPCRAHSDCASAACTPDGSCAGEAQVAYVNPAGVDNVGCTRADPCTRIASALATGRPVVKLHGTLDEAVMISDRNTTIVVEPGARLTRTNNGVVLEIRGTSQVAIDGLEITGGSNPGGIGISIPPGSSGRLLLSRARITDNAGGGLVAAGGTVVARRSVFFGNAGGGVSFSNGVEFDFENNLIAKNGNIVTGSFGGILITQTGDGLRRLEFNTITMNGGPPNVDTGVLCAAILKPTTFSNNIVYANLISGDGEQVAGENCAFTYSDIGPNSVPGPGNRDINPRYVNAMTNDFHLAADSPLIDVADPEATLATDLDGQARPQGARRDIGAYEYAP